MLFAWYIKQWYVYWINNITELTEYQHEKLKIFVLVYVNFKSQFGSGVREYVPEKRNHLAFVALIVAIISSNVDTSTLTFWGFSTRIYDQSDD